MSALLQSLLILLLLSCYVSASFLFDISHLKNYEPPSSSSDDYSGLEEEDLAPVYFMRHRRASRMCGEVLTKAMQKVCNNCVKPPGAQVFEKRSDFWRPKREEKVTDKCCKEKCSMDYLKKFCCE